MSKKRQRETMESILSATANLSAQVETLEIVSSQMTRAYQLMNLYAQDPYNMGAKDADGNPYNRQSRTDPQAVLAEVYMILAPAQQALMALFEDPSFEAIRGAALSEVESTVRKAKDEARKEINRVKAEGARHARQIMDRMAALERLVVERQAEVDRYLGDTSRYVRSIEDTSKRKIEL